MSGREIDGVAARELGGGKRDHSAPDDTSGHRAGPVLTARAEVMSGQCRGPLGRDVGCAGGLCLWRIRPPFLSPRRTLF